MNCSDRPLHESMWRRRAVLANSSQLGFTLIELVVAMTVIGIMILSISDLFISISKSQRQTAVIEAATRAGTEKIESLRNSSYIALTPGSIIDFTSELPDTIPTPRSALITVTEPVADLRKLDLVITVPHATTTREIRLTTVLGEIGIFP
jgi:prepilin-type N-terminal cleavage/methylation domain-containing protein